MQRLALIGLARRAPCAHALPRWSPPPHLRAPRRANTTSSTAAAPPPTSTSSSIPPPPPPPSSAGRLAGMAAFGVMVGTTLYLGAWQLERYTWKVGVVAQRTAALSAPPLDITSAPLASIPAPGADALQLVALSGVLDLSRAVLLTPRPPPKGVPERLLPASGNSGAVLVAPLRRPDGSELLVQRGWYPLAALPPRAGTERIDNAAGFLRASETPGMFAPPHRLAKGELAWMDVPTLARHVQLNGGDAQQQQQQQGPAVLVELVEPLPARRGEFPLTRQREALAQTYVMPMTHLVYSATWFTLSAFGAAIAFARFRRSPLGARRSLGGW